MRLFCVIFCFIFTISVFAGLPQNIDYSGDFYAYYNSAEADDYLDVIIEYNMPYFHADSLNYFACIEKHKRRKQITNYLKTLEFSYYSRETSFLHLMLKKGNIVEYTYHWLHPSVQLKIRKTSLDEFLDNFDFASILWNRQYKMIDDLPLASSARVLEETEIPWGISHIGTEDVWALGFEGDGVLVSIHDTGIRYTHDDIENSMWTNFGETPGNSFDDDGNGFIDDFYGYDFVNNDGDPMDDHRHGTHCAGTVAGDGTSGTQTGVAPLAKVMAVKVLGSSGSGTPSDFVEGIEYAILMDVDIMSMSVGWPEPSTTLSNFMRAQFEAILDYDIPAFISAGNSGNDYIDPPLCVDAPGNSPAPWYGDAGHTAAIAVGAVASTNVRAAFSGFGHVEWVTSPYTDYDSLVKPDIVAPGVSIKSLSRTSDTAYRDANGTSQSCPHAAGLAALMLSYSPNLSARAIDSLLETTALDLGDSGRDNEYGAGLIQALDAVNACPEPSEPVLGYKNRYIDDSSTGNDNSIADIGETILLSVAVKNYGSDASGVSLVIRSLSPHIAMSDSTTIIGAMTTNEIAVNTGDPFTVTILGTAPAGHTAEFILTSIAAGGYTFYDTFDIVISNYPRQYADIYFGGVNVYTVTNFGSGGYYDSHATIPLGSGFEYSGYNGLFTASLLLGYEDNIVSSGENGRSSDFVPINDFSYSIALYGDTELYTNFVDPKSGLIIYQRAISFNSAPNNDFVLLRYEIFNPTDSTITYNAGYFCDFDIHHEGGWYDRAVYDSSEDIVFMYDNDSPAEHPEYVGICGVTDMTTGSTINNAHYVYESGMGWTDEVKSDFLDGTLSFSSSANDSDWSIIISAGTKTIAPYTPDTIVFALVGGDSETDLRTNAEAARILSTLVLNIEENIIPLEKDMAISCLPNPFNDASLIDVHSTEIQSEEINIFDISGRQVYYSRIDLNQGHNIVRWKPSDVLGGGLYIIKVRDEYQKVLYIK